MYYHFNHQCFKKKTEKAIHTLVSIFVEFFNEILLQKVRYQLKTLMERTYTLRVVDGSICNLGCSTISLKRFG